MQKFSLSDHGIRVSSGPLDVLMVEKGSTNTVSQCPNLRYPAIEANARHLTAEVARVATSLPAPGSLKDSFLNESRKVSSPWQKWIPLRIYKRSKIGKT